MQQFQVLFFFFFFNHTHRRVSVSQSHPVEVLTRACVSASLGARAVCRQRLAAPEILAILASMHILILKRVSSHLLVSPGDKITRLCESSQKIETHSSGNIAPSRTGMK